MSLLFWLSGAWPLGIICGIIEAVIIIAVILIVKAVWGHTKKENTVEDIMHDLDDIEADMQAHERNFNDPIATDNVINLIDYNKGNRP